MDELKKDGKIIRVYDSCCGTGGMLTTIKRKLTDPESGLGIRPENIRLYGQDVNPEAYAICCAEMLMLGENPANIREGNTLTEDRFPGEKFNLLITNPPFGVEWKTEKKTVEEELKKPNNRFVAGTPRVSDGQLLFLQNLLAKAEDDARIAIILNGSPLFSGDAGSGESEIRRYVLTNHLLEAIVALPDQMFYNTGIYTYIWILSKKPNPRRNHKVQLIDATAFFVPQTPKSLGNKRKFIDDKSRAAIVREYTAFSESDISNNTSRGYIYTGELLEVLRNAGIRYSETTFRMQVIGKIRDQGVIIASSQKGYKIPSKKQELIDYINHDAKIVIPMLSRLKKCRDLIKLGTVNELDLLDSPEYETLKAYFDNIN